MSDLALRALDQALNPELEWWNIENGGEGGEEGWHKKSGICGIHSSTTRDNIATIHSFDCGRATRGTGTDATVSLRSFSCSMICEGTRYSGFLEERKVRNTPEIQRGKKRSQTCPGWP